MAFISLFILALSAVAGALEIFDNSTESLDKRSIPNTTGENNGFFYSVFADSTVTGSYTNGAGGEYTLEWGGSGDVVVGKGWNPGSAMEVTYSGTWTPSGNSYLSVYGWFTDPLIEYYINENFGTFNPSTGGNFLGTCTSDGSTYNIYTQTRTNEPSIQGTATFQQYWSIRQDQRVGGTVTTANHFSCFEAVGLPLGTFNYMIVATEGFDSSGTSQITVGQGPSTPSSPTTSAGSAPTSGSGSSGTAQEFGQCGGIGWTGPTVCQSPFQCEEINAYFFQCLS